MPPPSLKAVNSPVSITCPKGEEPDPPGSLRGPCRGPTSPPWSMGHVPTGTDGSSHPEWAAAFRGAVRDPPSTACRDVSRRELHLSGSSCREKSLFLPFHEQFSGSE